MALGNTIAGLRNVCLASLDASHNYYVHTKIAWQLVQEMVRQGRKVTIRNQDTGDAVDETELANLAQGYVAAYLVSATFQNFVSAFERFVFDFLSAWLTEYPGSLSGNQLSFRTVLNAADKAEIVSAVVEKEVLGIAYQRIADWFKYLEKLAQLGCPSRDQIERLAEIKASRDVLVHNNGIANSIYIEKSMGQARFVAGEALDLPEHYYRESWQLLRQVVTEVAAAGINKAENGSQVENGGTP